ncbi:MAG: BspA family leucine-rich repeat surface protein [Magnetococcus sp. WYHC-3]
MRTRSSRGNNGYIGEYAAHDDVTGIVSLNKKYLVNEYSNESNWERPTQWRQGPSVSAGEQKIVITNAVYDTDNNFTAFTMSGNFAVDWGDGTTGAFSSLTTASKNYDKTTYAGLTSDVFRGYKTLNIVITPQVGANFNGQFNFALKHPQSGLQSYYSNGYLEIIMSAPFATGPLTVSDTTFNNRSASRLLEHFKWIGDSNLTSIGAAFIGCFNLKIISEFPSTARCADFQSLFHSCQNLEWIPPSICETQNATNLSFMFYLCSRIKKVPGTLNTSKCTAMTQLFQDCIFLKRIPEINTSKVTSTSLQGLFAGCVSLDEIPGVIDAGSATSLANLFNSCRSLKYFPKVINTGNITNFSSMYLACQNLETVPYFDTTKGTIFNNMFNSSGIKGFDPAWGNTFDMINATDTNNMFRFCRPLERVPDTFITGATLTTANAMFYECYSLTKCPQIDVSNVTNMSEFFYNCRALKEMPNINIRPTANNFTNMFFQNWNLSACGVSGFSGANVSFANCSLGATALNNIYTNLGTVGASGSGTRTITVSGNWGTAADNPAIATAKGWAVSG